jgi:hypothetical protein
MDPSKFFNRKINIRNPKTPYNKGKFVDESENYSNRVSSRINQSPLTKSLFSLRNKVFQIENLLNGIFSIDKKKQEQNKKIKAAEVPDKKPKTKGPQIFGNLIQRPKTGALDLIKDFVTFTFLGWLFTRIQPLLGGLTKLGPLLEGMSWFIGGTLKNMVDVFATFLKLGFDAKEKFDSIAGDIKKNTKGIDKVFDNTLNPLKAVFTGVIQLTNSFLAVSVKEDELNEAKTQLAKEQSADNVPPLPPLPKADVPQTPPTSDPFPKTPPVQKFNTGGVIRGYNEGGRIDPRTPITRGVESQRREVPKPKPIIQPQKTAPGKDVGGDKKVKQLYDHGGGAVPDFIPLPSFFRSDKKSGFAALMGASEEYKKPMTNDILGIGNMMGASVDSALGQKIEKKSYTQFADGIKYLVNYGRTEPEEFAKIDLEDMVRKIVEPRVNMAINRIQEEINKKSTVEVTPGPGEGGGGLGGGAVSGNEYERAFLDLLAHAEGTTGSYGTLFGGAVNSDLAAGNLTVQEVINFSNSSVGGTGVLGRYQFMATTLQGLVRNGVLSLNEKFTPEKQDQAAIALARGRGVDPSKPLTVQDMYRLGGEWASIEGGRHMRKGGSYSYGKDGRSQVKYTAEKALKKYNELLEQVRTVSPSSFGSGNFLGNLQKPLPGITLEGQRYGAGRGGRQHAGRDYDLQTNDIFYSRIGGKVVKIEKELDNRGRRVGYGLYVDIYNKDLNRTERIAEGTNLLAGIAIGKMVFPGQPVVQGTHQTGVIHYEIRRNGGYGPRGTEDPDKFLNSLTYKNYIKNFNNTATKQAPRPPELQRITQTPPGEPYLIKGKMYYVDLKNNKVFTTNEEGDRVEVKVGPGQNERLLKEIYKMRQLRPNQKISFSKISPNVPEQKYASYNQPDSQEPSYIQPLIINNPIPVPVSSGPVAFVNPRISNPIPIT